TGMRTGVPVTAEMRIWGGDMARRLEGWTSYARAACGLVRGRERSRAPGHVNRGCCRWSFARHSKDRPHVTERDHEQHGIERRRLEAEGQVKTSGLVGDRMHDDAANADAVGRVCNACGA